MAQGSTLVISMLLLSTISLLGLGAMQGAVLEEKMAHNFRFGEAAFHASESGLQQAISNHTENQIIGSFNGTVGQSDYTTTVTESSGTYTIVSQATDSASGARRTLTIELSGTPGEAPTLLSWHNNE